MMAERDFTWAELYPSVFDQDAEFPPDFKPLGNEGGDDRIFVSWQWGSSKADSARIGRITVSTADPEESDIDVIEAHWTFATFHNREAWTEAYRLARKIAKGGKFADVEPGFVYEQPGGWFVEPAPYHIRRAA